MADEKELRFKQIVTGQSMGFRKDPVSGREIPHPDHRFYGLDEEGRIWLFTGNEKEVGWKLLSMKNLGSLEFGEDKK